MAWIVHPKPLPRWTVGTETVPSRQDLHALRKAYRFAHPERHPFADDVTRQGFHVPERLWPVEAHVLSSTRNPPDFLTMSGYGLSERVKDLIEALEPGVHQFVQVPTFLRRGDPAPSKYFAVALGRIANGQIDDEATTIKRTSIGTVEWPTVDGRRGLICIRRDQTRSWHAWISADIPGALTVSDELHHLFVRANIPGLDHVRLLEK